MVSRDLPGISTMACFVRGIFSRSMGREYHEDGDE